MTESVNYDLLTNGSSFSAGSSSGGFNVGNLWDGVYDFSALGGTLANCRGEIPIPSQTKIDRWQRAMGTVTIEFEAAEEAEQKARNALSEDSDQRSVEEKKAEMEKALKEKNEVIDKFRDALADVCSNKPTRKQLAGVPENFVLLFVQHVGRLLNPEV